MSNEKDDGFIRIKRPGRPMKPFSKPSTMARTYSFFDEDINKAINNGWTPKEVFRLGILAKEGNTAMIDRIREVEEMNVKLSSKLQKLAARNYELEEKFKTINKEVSL